WRGAWRAGRRSYAPRDGAPPVKYRENTGERLSPSHRVPRIGVFDAPNLDQIVFGISLDLYPIPRLISVPSRTINILIGVTSARVQGAISIGDRGFISRAAVIESPKIAGPPPAFRPAGLTRPTRAQV